jgi:hypothetical protein
MNENRVVAQLSNSAGEKEQKYMFYCEGCKQNHMFDERWTFNGDIIKPTFTPSLLYTIGHHPDPSDICHSYVTDGKIQFLSDCTHELAGQTIDLKPID